jgi:peptidoglycan/xylan/chitin deacetylase (PgdA/CDA1 family)
MAFRPVVLCYHAVTDRWDDQLAVSPQDLERQLRLLLAARLRPVTAEDVLRNRRRTFHVTFDDAYRSVAPVVPVLERLGVPVTIFVCTDLARVGGPMAVPELKGHAGKHPEELCTMDWDALADLAARGVEIGSHTASHPHLPVLSDAELRRELADSRQEIEARLQRRCRFLSYPFGEEDARVRSAAKEAGYTAAYVLRGDFHAPSPLALPRVDVYRADGPARFAVKASPLGPAALTALRRVRARRAAPRRATG